MSTNPSIADTHEACLDTTEIRRIARISVTFTVGERHTLFWGRRAIVSHSYRPDFAVDFVKGFITGVSAAA
jgi:hypothetical protein